MKLNEKYLKTDEIIGEGNQLLKSQLTQVMMNCLRVPS